MTTKTTSTVKSVHTAEYGNSVVFHDSIDLATTDIDAADIIKFLRVPAGTAAHRVVTKPSADMDTGTNTLTAKIGFTPVDGSAAVSGADTAVSADTVWGTAATVATFEVFPPYKVEVDSYLTIVIGTGANAAAAATLYAKVEGECLGHK